jgi:predicted metal-dependent hydrolase
MFNDMTDGAFAESLAPLLLTAAKRSGTEIRRFEVLHQQTLRDLSTYMEALLLARGT